MSQSPAAALSTATPSGGTLGVSPGASASASASEKSANAAASPGAPSPGSAQAPKKRSCVTCRARKVRCDKLSPCSNCRRGKIDCVFPSGDRPPRWARRLERLNQIQGQPPPVPHPVPEQGAGQVMERLRNLEDLVKELTGQLEHANAAGAMASAVSAAPSSENSPSATHRTLADNHRDGSPSAAAVMQQNFGRLVIQDAGPGRYLGSGFWSRVNDEIQGLKMDTEVLAGEDSEASEYGDSPDPSSTHELSRTPADRHAFLFGHNLSSSSRELDEFRPLPSQVPFLLDVYSENVNQLVQFVHMPTIRKMIRESQGSQGKALSPPNDALMFSIYYAAVTSMEEEDAVKNFGVSKVDLNLKFRVGLELALARADFLNVPDIALIQAFAIFLALVRRHDSPRYVWMLAGIAIRMAQALGLQRDGSHFPGLTPFEAETRRRVWWALVALDIRASEDQGLEMSIIQGTFDTKLPININDEDLTPETKEMPVEQEKVTDMTFAKIFYKTCEITRGLVNDLKEQIPSSEELDRMVHRFWEPYEEAYLQPFLQSGDIKAWVGMTVARLVMAKMTLLLRLPVLFASSSEQLTNELRTKLFISSIELAEHNHALNAEHSARQWRWVYQTYTHWHAIVYMLIEIPRRPWSPIVERAWVALQSPWLIPPQSNMSKNMRVWIPLRKLITKARKHRESELERLQNNVQAALKVEADDSNIPAPRTPSPTQPSVAVEMFRARWRKVVGLSPPDASISSFIPPTQSPASTIDSAHAPPSNFQFGPSTEPAVPAGYVASYGGSPGALLGQDLSQAVYNLDPATTLAAQSQGVPAANYFGGDIATTSMSFPPVSAEWTDTTTLNPNFTPWLWADANPSMDVFANMGGEDVDINMDMDSDMDWYNWVESAKGLEVTNPDAGSNNGATWGS